jgi:outer membrane lipopolysaccharide assembly protein LptE/RlpB
MKLTVQSEKPYGATMTIEQAGLYPNIRFSVTKTPSGYDPELDYASDEQHYLPQQITDLEEADARLLLKVLAMLLGPEPQTVYSVGV